MAWAPFTESSSFIEDVIECLQDIVSREDLQLLVTEDKAWETILAEAGLTRDEADVLREALKGLIDDMAKMDQERQHEGQQARERFLALFPQLKVELMEDIKKLHALAGQANKVHLNYILTNVLGVPNATASEILTLLDLVMASFTARGQPAPSGQGDKSRARSSVTEVSSSPEDHSSTLPDQDEARDLMSAIVEKLTRFTESVGRFPPKVFSPTENWKQFLEGVGKNISAIKLASSDLELINKVKLAIKMENIMVQDGTELVQTTFGHTAVAISRETKIFCTATGAVFLGLDLYNLVQNSVYLQEGEKSVLGNALREQAQELESILEHLNQAYEHLKSDSSE
ncbi:PREDICTED: apolipoprotein L2-like [Chinchilla lanigera]|uniref:Apolipoprotein L2-like n=1 Tax=Chinchilla lanigera TaxID=34839 RepID=A0A8C2W2K8_CHILA|nr:PREDICTED: apolipoprotein L2-like [Chinchilla lanigera]